ncbi:MAG: glutathione transferase GstA [Spongiibacteraceae bacterium]|jgi:glutathione S-transferase|nr:glutathione transferase GstA [Spongiibacteraceae bacterium]
MKLYYMPGACSLASHIVLREALIPVELVKVDGRTKKTEDGHDFTEINPLGYVPALQFDNGEVLTEGAAIMQYAGDQAPMAGLVPSPISFERYRFQAWLNLIATELHKSFTPLFVKQLSAEEREEVVARIGTRFDYFERHLADNEYLMGREYTAVDAYLFVMLGWAAHHDIALDRWPSLKAFRDRIGERPKVQEALQAEGLA